jgi:putative tricarboxylic transport membrane protein
MTIGQNETKRRPDRAALVIGAALAALGVLLIWQGLGIPDKGGYAGVASGDIPVAIGALLLVLAVAHWVTGLRRSAGPMEPIRIEPVLWIVGGLALQLALLRVLGFSIASGLLFACTAAAFGKRNLALTLPIGVVFAFCVYAVFDRLLSLKLPAGIPETLIFGG